MSIKSLYPIGIDSLLNTESFNSEFINNINEVQKESSEAYKDQFPIVVEEGDIIVNGADLGPTKTDPSIESTKNLTQLFYKTTEVELPLNGADYYYGKWINAKAGINELNRMPVLVPDNRISVIRDGYITLGRNNGYVNPTSGFYYGSGVCWSVSTLGQLMDQANYEFKQKYGVPLFVFKPGDRTPHSTWTRTYKNSNYGHGYTILKTAGGTDYTFTVNPELSNNAELKNIKILIVLFAKQNNPNAYKGQSVGGYIMSNVEF